MKLCKHGNTYTCLQCEVECFKYVNEEQQKEIEGLKADLKQANALLQWEQDYSEKKHLKNIQLQEKVERYEKALNEIVDTSPSWSANETYTNVIRIAVKALKD